MKFEYDPKKSVSNKSKHGTSLEEAKKLWSKPYLEIEARTLDEPRYMLIGKIDGKFYSCIYIILENVVDPRYWAQHLDSSSYVKIYLITN